MEKARFYYIGKVGSRNIPQNEFFAIKLSKKDKEKLHPNWTEDELKKTTILCPQTDTYGDDKVFVSGIGWKKFGKTNKIVVPIFSGYIEDWDEYLEKYGKECLYYSLTGYSLYDMDCCAYSMQREFWSILQCDGGIEKYQKYVENIEEIQRIQKKVFKEKLSYMSDWEMKYFVDENLFKPCFNVFFITMPPYLDTPADDVKMENFYRRYRNHEIKSNHPDYERFNELREKIYDKDFYKVSEEYDLLRNRINDTITDTLEKEMNDDSVFPCCMSDRMKMLFGEKCSALYNYILKHFN